MNTVILTDSSCDLPLEFIKENKINFLGLICHLSYGDFKDDFGETLSHKDFYNSVRDGEMPTTSQINTYRFKEAFKSFCEAGNSVIYIGMSSAISGCINSALVARNELLEENPNFDISIVDTKGASIGEGLLVYKALEMLKKGSSKEEILSWLEDNKLNVNYCFTVDNLKHLRKGGRLSYTAATLGTLLDIKPIICINDKGELINVCNVRGRKKAIKTLIKNFEENCINPEETVVGISHGDCLEEALALKEHLMEKYNVKRVIVGYVGPVIGSHTGPGMLSLCFIGKNNRNF